MASLSAVFPTAHKLLSTTEKLVSELNEHISNGEDHIVDQQTSIDTTELENQASSSVNQMMREIQNLHFLLQKETGSRKQAWQSYHITDLL